MYLWLAINLDDQLSLLREQAEQIEKRLTTENTVFGLPLHVSLKISFFVPDDMVKTVVNTIKDYYLKIIPFYILPFGIERENSIVWIRMKESEQLCKIHNDLDDLLSCKYGIKQHMFDLDFKFHTTLFMDSDSEKVELAYNLLKNIEIPGALAANELIIGSSNSGKIGTYKVDHYVKI